MFNPLFLCVYFDKIPLGVPEKRKLFWGKGVNCAKHKRHVAPNSLVNLGETVQCTVS